MDDNCIWLRTHYSSDPEISKDLDAKFQSWITEDEDMDPQFFPGDLE